MNKAPKLFGVDVEIKGRRIEDVMMTMACAAEEVLDAAKRDGCIIDGMEWKVREDFVMKRVIISCRASGLEIREKILAGGDMEDESEIDQERG